jgi:predicted Zn-dependent peptidase
VELLLSAPAAGGAHPDDLVDLDAIVRKGKPSDLPALLRQVAVTQKSASPQIPSDDPATRLQQLITRQTEHGEARQPAPLAIIVSGNVTPSNAFTAIEKQFGGVVAGRLSGASPLSRPPGLIREKIDRPLPQGGLGYVVEGPPPGTREAFAWRMLLYILTHDYSGRLGNSAIRDKGLVYHIYSLLGTDGQRSWATISTGVDPDKADAMEAELRAQLAGLATEPPTQAEADAARGNLLGRDLSAAQSNDELTAKLALQFIENGDVRSHEQLRAMLQTITPADLAAISRDFAKGTVIRVDVAKP